MSYNDLIPILQEELGQYENFTLIHKDALKVDFNEIIGDEKSVKLVETYLIMLLLQ